MPVQFSVVEIFDVLEEHMAEQEDLELAFPRGGAKARGVASESPPLREPRPPCLHPLEPPTHRGGSPEHHRGVGPGDGQPRTGKSQTPLSPLPSSVTGVGSSGIGTATASMSRVGLGGRVRARARETLVRGVKVPRGGGVSRPRPPARGLWLHPCHLAPRLGGGVPSSSPAQH